VPLADIETQRLVLRLVPLQGLEATIAHDGATLDHLLRVAVPPVWFEHDWLAQWRLEQWQADAAYAPWSIRAIIERQSNSLIGAMNCHHGPMDFIHGDSTRPAVELGYDIYEGWRRKGYGYEAVSGFIDWAADRGVPRFILSIQPGNAASNALCRKLGGRQIGAHIDEVDGPEDIYMVDAVA
jgi:[ribosomal protein S5]-alanine N-acetyltransferase